MGQILAESLCWHEARDHVYTMLLSGLQSEVDSVVNTFGWTKLYKSNDTHSVVLSSGSKTLKTRRFKSAIYPGSGNCGHWPSRAGILGPERDCNHNLNRSPPDIGSLIGY